MKLLLRIAFLVLAVTGAALGQAARFDSVAQTTQSINGTTVTVPAPSASITVCSYPATVVSGSACTNKASVCPDITAVGCTSTAPNNPVTADAQGNFGFWTAGGVYQYTVCPQSGSCQGPFNAVIPFGITGGIVSGTSLTLSGVLDITGGKLKGYDGFVNVVDDCGAVGDNVTDDYTAIQNCLDNNPGKHIIFPKRAASNAGGGTATNFDYYSSQQLIMSGNAQWLEGELPANWTGAASIRFPTGVAGIRMPSNLYSGKISNLELRGGDCWTSSDLTTFEDWRGTEANLLRGTGADGIQLLGGEPRLENVNVACFKRHGIYISGDGTITSSPASQPDFWRFDRVELNSNRGDGIFVNGGDSNAGAGTLVDTRSNALSGIRDNAPLTNTWVAAGSHTNHRDGILAGTTQALTSCAVASNVITCTTPGALANGINTLNTWVTTAGEVDATFDTTFRVTAFDGTLKTVTGSFTHADGSTTGGTIGKASSAQVYGAWSTAGIRGGCFGGSAQRSTWITPYTESGQGIGNLCAWWATGTLVIGGNSDPSQFGDLSTGTPSWLSGGTTTTLFVPLGITVREPREQALNFNLRSGLAARQDVGLRFMDYAGAVKHTIKSGSTGSLSFTDTSGVIWFSKTEGGNALLRGSTATEDVVINQTVGRDTLFYCGTATICGKFLNSDSGFYVLNGVRPITAGGTTVGTNALPFSSVYIGGAATNNIQVTGTATSAKTATLPDNTGTVAELNLAQSFTAAQTFTQQMISSLATGTAPLSIASTTPVANLTTVPTTYNHSGTQQTATHLVQDSCTLGTDCAVTLTGSAVFTSSTSYTCSAEDQTAAAATKIVQASGSAFTITGTGTDAIRYLCIGN